MTSCNYDAMVTTLARFGGVVRSGAHEQGDACCILEAAAVCQGLPWTDNPETVGRPDIRRLNDARWSSDALRTEHMLRLYLALEPWATWTADERRAYMDRVAIATVREIVAELPRLPDAVRVQCSAVQTREEARKAAYAASAAGVADTAAATTAAYAAYAATAATDADAVLIRAVDLWIAAVESEVQG